jgi:hypothetical protein
MRHLWGCGIRSILWARGTCLPWSSGPSTSPLAAMLGGSVLFSLVVLLTAGAQSVPTPKAQCEELLNAVLPMAKKLLSAHGEFYPFGASMKPDGQIVQTAAYDGREHPPSEPLIDLLRQSFRAQAKDGAIIASATIYDVRTMPPGATDKTDAVAVELDHRDSYSVIVLFPYIITAGTVQFGAAFAHKGTFAIFGKHDG